MSTLVALALAWAVMRATELGSMELSGWAHAKLAERSGVDTLAINASANTSGDPPWALAGCALRCDRINCGTVRALLLEHAAGVARATARVVSAVRTSLGRNSQPGFIGSVRRILHPLQRANLVLVDAYGIFCFARSHSVCRVERQIRWQAN